MVLVFEDFDSGIPAQASLETIFGLMPRIALGSLAAYLISQFLDVKIFSKLKVKFPTRSQLWIRNNVSTGISQSIDTLIFCSIAFIGLYSWNVWWEIVITTYVLKFIISVASTPVIYWARSFKFKSE
jgi:uncharacterized integral membrane protein (TIGR00697 family)